MRFTAWISVSKLEKMRRAGSKERKGESERERGRVGEEESQIENAQQISYLV